jgi:hydrogenase expression/formation protein HypD
VGCRCGDVLRGVIDPPECPVFDAGCDPDTPIGACMVSSEGTCAAWYRHERWNSETVS